MILVIVISVSAAIVCLAVGIDVGMSIREDRIALRNVYIPKPKKMTVRVPLKLADTTMKPRVAKPSTRRTRGAHRRIAAC